jgi:hypothetical protein
VAQHESILSHLFSEISGTRQQQTAAHPSTSAGTASPAESGLASAGAAGASVPAGV